MVNVYIENYGCTANYDNGAIIAGILTEAGHEMSTGLEDADLVIINSCAVKNTTVNKIYDYINKIIKNCQNKKIIIAGCMAIAEKKKLNKFLKNGTALVSTQNITKIPEIIEKLMQNEQVILTKRRKEIKLGFNKIIEDKVASIQIGEGCLSNCTFCSTKLAKGGLISYPKEKVIEEVKNYVNLGYKRINLTSTDNGCYGFDLGYNLTDLLNEVVKIDGNFILRVGMMNPEHVKKYLDGLIEVYKNKKIIKFLHVPIQTGSDKVLKDMKRNGTVKEFEEIVNKFRKEIKNIIISTDIIVGYPTENLEDFEKTLDLVKRLKFRVINISKFSPRTGTLASKLKQIDTKEVKRRSRILTEVYKSIKNK